MKTLVKYPVYIKNVAYTVTIKGIYDDYEVCFYSGDKTEAELDSLSFDYREFVECDPECSIANWIEITKLAMKQVQETLEYNKKAKKAEEDFVAWDGRF